MVRTAPTLVARFRIEELDDLVGRKAGRARTPPVGHAQHGPGRKSRPARGNELTRTLALAAIPANLSSRPVKTYHRLPEGVDHVERAVRAEKHDHRIADVGLPGLLQDDAVQQEQRGAQPLAFRRGLTTSSSSGRACGTVASGGVEAVREGAFAGQHVIAVGGRPRACHCATEQQRRQWRQQENTRLPVQFNLPLYSMRREGNVRRCAMQRPVPSAWKARPSESVGTAGRALSR